jgi:hypothetical protein
VSDGPAHGSHAERIHARVARIGKAHANLRKAHLEAALKAAEERAAALQQQPAQEDSGQ